MPRSVDFPMTQKRDLLQSSEPNARADSQDHALTAFTSGIRLAINAKFRKAEVSAWKKIS